MKITLNSATDSINYNERLSAIKDFALNRLIALAERSINRLQRQIAANRLRPDKDSEEET